MKLTPVESSMIRAVGYDDDTRTLVVAFAGGRAYTYADVPRAVYDGLLTAESKGKYLNAAVRGKYAHKQRDGPEQK